MRTLHSNLSIKISVNLHKPSPDCREGSSNPECSSLLPDDQLEPPKFKLWSPAFNDGETVPDSFCCMRKGARVNKGRDWLRASPPLEWRREPYNTSSYVLLMDNSDTGFVHWLVSGDDWCS